MCLIVTHFTALRQAGADLKGKSASGAHVAPGRVSISGTARRATSTLVAVEVALAIVLLVDAGLTRRSFARLLAVDPGFQTDSVMTMEIAVPTDRYKDADARRACYDRAVVGLMALPTSPKSVRPP
jgi:hypothetical protein